VRAHPRGRFNPRAVLILPAIIATGLALAACGSSSSGGSSSSSSATATGASKPQTVRIALDYTANVDYLGIYAAIANGYFAQQGIDPQIIPYAETPAETLIQSGKTDLGISYPPEVVLNRAKGLKYKAVAALVDGNTTALAVLASSSYLNPAQLSGKLYGGFGIPGDKPIISTIIKGAGVANPKFREVVLNTDVIQALSSHRIDYTAVFGGIDDVTAELEGTKLRTFPYRQFLGEGGNYPNAVYVASDEDIAKRGPALKAALKALAEGYEFAAKNPARAEQILIKENETALGKSQKIVTATGNATAKTFVPSSGVWGQLESADFSGLEKILTKSGLITGTPPPASDFYTNSLLPGG
jgi:ABC-type nitrate/sulfonate/bicarbonate transport system substrate-binding protein